MKDYREVAEIVLERRDAYVEAKKSKRKAVRIAAVSLSAFCLIALAGIGILQDEDDTAENGIFAMMPSTLDNIGTIPEENGSADNLAVKTDPALNSTSGSDTIPDSIVPVNYSSLELPAGQIGEDIIAQYSGSSSAAIDIASFDENMLSKCCAVLEGTITDMYIKRYTYDTYHDKFGEKDLYHNTASSVVYELEVDRIWYGDESLSGTSVLIEDSFFLADSYFSLKTGCRYVIPIYDCGETIYLRTEEYAGGDITRDSIYSTLYPYHPQIEVTTDGNYVVPGDWETLCSDGAREINLDVFDDTLVEYHPQLDSDEGGFITTEWRTLFISKYDAYYYYNKMKLIDADAFGARLLQLVSALE